MEKALFSLAVDNYPQEITDITFPLMQKWAQKIGADFHVITERQFPNFPATYEKCQLYHLGYEMNYDWVLFADADLLIDPDNSDFTQYLAPNTIATFRIYSAAEWWKSDEYFDWDGRNRLSIAPGFVITPKSCLTLWKPLDDLTQAEALSRIKDIGKAELAVLTRLTGDTTLCNRDKNFFLDEYTMSRNIAKHGIQCVRLLDLCEQHHLTNKFYHPDSWDTQRKIAYLRKMVCLTSVPEWSA